VASGAPGHRGLFRRLYPATFLSPQNLLVNILETVSFLVIVAAGQTVVMVVGDFDLSVGGLAALATSFTAALIATTTLAGDPQDPGSVPLAVGIGLAVGLICGIVNGLLVAYLGVMAFIATLGMSVAHEPGASATASRLWARGGGLRRTGAWFHAGYLEQGLARHGHRGVDLVPA
jgi:ribose/xylose/arabinose/galactoside ABC-type transport system permease subunit